MTYRTKSENTDNNNCRFYCRVHADSEKLCKGFHDT